LPESLVGGPRGGYYTRPLASQQGEAGQATSLAAEAADTAESAVATESTIIIAIAAIAAIAVITTEIAEIAEAVVTANATAHFCELRIAKFYFAYRVGRVLFFVKALVRGLILPNTGKIEIHLHRLLS
jgi:hypothetical protein